VILDSTLRPQRLEYRWCPDMYCLVRLSARWSGFVEVCRRMAGGRMLYPPRQAKDSWQW
jgi:hypothetical protein